MPFKIEFRDEHGHVSQTILHHGSEAEAKQQAAEHAEISRPASVWVIDADTGREVHIFKRTY